MLWERGSYSSPVIRLSTLPFDSRSQMYTGEGSLGCVIQ